MKHLLKLHDRKFSRDSAMLFHAYNVLQRRNVALHTSLQVVNKPNYRSTAARIDSITNESLEELLRSVENRTAITDPNIKKLMSTLSSAGSQITGSIYQKSCNRREIFGLMIKYGTPALWITISPAGSHSPIFMHIAGQLIDFDLEIPSHTQRAELFAKDPVAAAVYYNTVLDAFCDYLLGYKQDNGGIFGHVSAYYGMTEEQLTGTLHNHMLVWLQNSPSPTEIQEKLKNQEFKDRLLRYLETIIKQSYPDIDIADEDLNVSEVSCKHPINPDDHVNSTDFEEKLNEDVYKLVKVANTHSCRHTCYQYR